MYVIRYLGWPSAFHRGSYAVYTMWAYEDPLKVYTCLVHAILKIFLIAILFLLQVLILPLLLLLLVRLLLFFILLLVILPSCRAE